MEYIMGIRQCTFQALKWCWHFHKLTVLNLFYSNLKTRSEFFIMSSVYILNDFLNESYCKL